MGNDLKLNELYKRITVDTIMKRCEEWAIKKGILTIKEIQNMDKKEHIITLSYMHGFVVDMLDWCKLYTYDEYYYGSNENISEDAQERLDLYNLQNTVAFNQSIMNLREAGIRLPDCESGDNNWIDHHNLKEMIKNGAKQSEIEELFPLVFHEYTVMPKDVDLNDPNLERYTTIGGFPVHNYADNTLFDEEYDKNVPWSIKDLKSTFKDV